MRFSEQLLKSAGCALEVRTLPRRRLFVRRGPCDGATAAANSFMSLNFRAKVLPTSFSLFTFFPDTFAPYSKVWLIWSTNDYLKILLQHFLSICRIFLKLYSTFFSWKKWPNVENSVLRREPENIHWLSNDVARQENARQWVEIFIFVGIHVAENVTVKMASNCSKLSFSCARRINVSR